MDWRGGLLGVIRWEFDLCNIMALRTRGGVDGIT